MNKPKLHLSKMNWRKLGLEFLSIFIAVVSAFALNNWNENRRDRLAADKILSEISNGLVKDIKDVKLNIQGHEQGIIACQYWRDILHGKSVEMDKLQEHYSNLTRDFISIQNISGYETLKSRGLELIEDDSLRFQIINLYEYDYNVLKKFEEEYHEMQYQKNYFKEINDKIAPQFKFNEDGAILSMNLPLQISEREKNILLSYLWKIQGNRRFILMYYSLTEEKLTALKQKISTHSKR